MGSLKDRRILTNFMKSNEFPDTFTNYSNIILKKIEKNYIIQLCVVIR